MGQVSQETRRGVTGNVSPLWTRVGPRSVSLVSDGIGPAAITRTSAEILGRRGLPRALEGRPLVCVLGPSGVGKTTVAERLLQGLPVTRAVFHDAVCAAARRGGWSRALEQAPALLFDDLACLHGRVGAVGLLADLLERRAAAGLRTVLCQGADDSLPELTRRVACAHRATLLLRFPVGCGRRRHVQRRASALGVPWDEARACVTLEPWTYATVDAALQRPR
ncbi:MAG: hypothetical protein RLZZ299_2141 [Pseudomonadota bacterium]